MELITENTSSQKTLSTISNKERAFVDLYFSCNMNATEAYSILHPKTNRDSCRSRSSALLTNANVREEISKRLTEQAMGKEEVFARLSNMARASEMPFIKITEDGFVYFDFNNPNSKEYIYLIKKIKTKRTRRIVGHGEEAEPWEDEWVEVELHDAQTALNTIAKCHGMLTDKVEVAGADGSSIKISVSLKNDNEL